MGVLATATVDQSVGSVNLNVPVGASGAATVKISSVNYPGITRQQAVSITAYHNISNVQVKEYVAAQWELVAGNLVEGTEYAVKWDDIGSSSNCKIEIVDSTSGAVLYTISSSQPKPTDEGYHFTYPESVNVADVKIKVTSLLTDTGATSTAFPVTISRSFTSLTAPASVTANQSFTVDWTSDDIDGDVTIELIQ